MDPRYTWRRFRVRELLLAAALLGVGAGTGYAADVKIGGNICKGTAVQKTELAPDGTQVPVFINGRPVMVPEMACAPVAGAQVMVQDMEGSIITYGSVEGNAWSAMVPGPDPAAPQPVNQVRYVAMFSAPGHDATSREYMIDAKRPGLSVTSQNAYLAELPLTKANLLVYAFKDRYLNTEDDFPDDPPFNNIKFIVKDKKGNIAKMTDAQGNLVDAIGVSGSQPVINTADGMVIQPTDGLFYFTGLEPGEYTVEVDETSVPGCKGSAAGALATTYDKVCDPNSTVCYDIAPRCAAGWYLNSTIEGGRQWEVALYPGDPGTVAGGYMAWFSFVERLDNDLKGTANAGKIEGKLRDADGPFFADEPWAPVNPFVSPNTAIKNGLVVLWKDTLEVDPANRFVGPSAVATATTDANGYFSFVNVPPGAYRLFYEDLDLHYIWQETRVTVQPNATVSLLPDMQDPTGAAVDNALYAPKWFGVIDGYVHDVTGLEVNETTVCQKDALTGLLSCSRAAAAVNAPGVAGSKVRLRLKDGSVWKEYTVTDPSGYFRFDDLPEVEVLGHIEVEPPADPATGLSMYHGKQVTEQYPSITYAKNGGSVVPVIDGTGAKAYRFNLGGRSLVWFAANYRVNLQLEKVPQTGGDINGYAYYDTVAPGAWQADGTYDRREESTLSDISIELFYPDGRPVTCVEKVPENITAVLADGAPLLDAAGQMYAYAGAPITLTDPAGNALTLSVDTAGQVALTDSMNNPVQLMNASNLPVALTLGPATRYTVKTILADPSYCADASGSLLDANGNPYPARTRTAEVDEAALMNQGYQPTGSVMPVDDFGGVYKGAMPGFYEFRGLPAGSYMVKAVPPALVANPAAPAFYASPLGTDSRIVQVAAGSAAGADFGLSTFAPASVTLALADPTGATKPSGVPLAGEIEGGVFDDLNVQTNSESLLWDEKKPLSYAVTSVYDHLGYFLGATRMGNDLCHQFSEYANDTTVCPEKVEGPELEYRLASGPHIYVGNDPAPWLTEFTCARDERVALDPTGRPIPRIDPATNAPALDPVTGKPLFEMAPAAYKFPDKSSATLALEGPNAVQTYTYCYRDNQNPAAPGSAYYPGYEPLPWTYTFDQGKNKYEADWSLLPLSIQEAPPMGGPLGNDLIHPQGAPVIRGIEVAPAAPPAAPAQPPVADNGLSGLPMYALNDTGTLSDAGVYQIASASPVIMAERSGSRLMRISGSNFGDEVGFSTVTLSGEKLHILKWSDTAIDVLLPGDAVPGPLLVATPTGISRAIPVSIQLTPDQQAYMDARSVYVDAKAVSSGNGTKASPYRTIGEALKHLPEASPRYVFVAPGAYRERIEIGKSNVRLIGSGPDETVIDGRSSLAVSGGSVINTGGPVVKIGRGGLSGGVSGVAVSGFTITGGSANGEGGGGVFGDFGNRKIDINNNVIKGNGGEYGGGVWLHNSNHDVHIWSNAIHSNGNTGGYGGGVSVTDEPEYETGTGQPPEGSPFHHTWDDHFPGPPPGTYHVYNNRVFDNFSMDYGGGLSFYEIKDKLLVYGNYIAGNKADDHGGGIFMEESGPAEIHSNVIARNYAADDGGAISLEDVGDDISTVQIYNNMIVENIADDRGENTGTGGAIGLDDALYVSIFNNTIAGNIVAGTGTLRGGAIGSERHGHEYSLVAPGFSDARVHNNIIWSNWRLSYDPANRNAEALDFRSGVNYRWAPDNLFNDDPRVNGPWSSGANANTFSAVKSNVLSGGYASGTDNIDADSLFASSAAQPWVLAPYSANGRAVTAGIPLAETGKPGPLAPWTNAIVRGAMLNPAQVAKTFYSGTGSDVFGVKLADGLTLVDLSVPATQRITNVSVTQATGAVRGASLPYGNLNFTVSTPAGGCVNAALHFSVALPGRLGLYAPENSGRYSEVPYRTWTQTGPSSLDLTLCDGGDLDRDRLEDGKVAGTIALGEVINIPPVANAGRDAKISLGQGISLDGTRSYDPNGDFLASYAWSIHSAPAGSAAVVSGAGGPNASFIPDVEGDYVISLVVNDGTINGPADTVLITVRKNMPPDASARASTASGASPLGVSFDGSASSDPENGTLTHTWDFGDPASGANVATGPYASHTYGAPGVYTAVLTVTDNAGNSDQATVNIAVDAANAAPVVNTQAKPSRGAGPLNVLFTANASDPENGALSYVWDFGDGTPVSAEPNPTHLYTEPGSYKATVKVSDGAHTVEGSVMVTVETALMIDVLEARIDGGEDNGKAGGEINLKARFASSEALSPASIVRLTIDGFKVLDTTLASFRSEGGELKYSDGKVHAKIDPANGLFKVSGHKLILKKIDPKDGVDVVMTIGSASASDSFQVEIEDVTKKKFSYKKSE